MTSLKELTGKDIDRYLRAKKKEKAAADKLAEAKAETRLIEDELIEKWNKSTKRIDGKLGSLTYKEQKEFTCKDWNSFYKYVIKKKDFSLLQKRLGQAAIREQTEAGVKIPGLQSFTKKSFNIGWKRG